jgi:hypothetical protein
LVDQVRETNMGFKRRITNELETGAQASFERVFNKTAFPDIYTETAAAARFRAALGREDLTSDQRTTLEQLRAQFEREAGALRSQLVEAALEENPVEELMSWGRRGGDDEEREVREEVEELSARYVDQIENLLTPEQRESLRGADPSDWRNRSFDP